MGQFIKALPDSTGRCCETLDRAEPCDPCTCLLAVTFYDISTNPDTLIPLDFPAGIIGDCVHFYGVGPALGSPRFKWYLSMVGCVGASTGWGRQSFTIRYWWRADTITTSHGPYAPGIWGEFASAEGSTYILKHMLNARSTGPAVGGVLPIIEIPTLRFRVYDGLTVLGSAEYLFTQSPRTLGGGVGPYSSGGVIGPLVEMTTDTWHRTIAWYDADALEIGVQLDDLSPVVAGLSGPIPAGPSQSLTARFDPDAPEYDWDFAFDEYGLWNGYVWTADERAADWNGGASVGWPDILTTIAEPPMAYWRFEDPADVTADGILSMV